MKILKIFTSLLSLILVFLSLSCIVSPILLPIAGYDLAVVNLTAYVIAGILGIVVSSCIWIWSIKK